MWSPNPSRSLFLSFLLAAGCGSAGLPPVVDPSDLPAASGPPTLARIRDLGTPLVPRSGSFDASAVSDGSAGPGELLLVEGNRFGRQPTVLVGGRPAAVLARTSDGGVVVRVPRGVRTGLVDVSVGTAAGTARLATELRRLAVVRSGDELRFAALGATPVALPGSLRIPGARDVAVDSSGALALVLAEEAGASRLSVVDLGRAQPALLGALPLPHRATLVTVAVDASRAIAIGGGKLSVVDTTSSRRPVLFDAAALPAEARDPVAAALSPDGKTLALLVAPNRLVALDVTSPTAALLVSSVDILPGERQKLVSDVAFSPDGQMLWVVSGVSAATYPQVVPARISAVKMLVAYADGSPAAEARMPTGPVRRMLSVWKTQAVPGVVASPVSLVVGAPPDQSGSAIRSAPEVAAVYFTAVRPPLLEAGTDARKTVALLGSGDAGVLARAELGTGGGPVASTREALGRVALLEGGARAAALAWSAGPNGLTVGVELIGLNGDPGPRFVSLGAASTHEGSLAVQP